MRSNEINIEEPISTVQGIPYKEGSYTSTHFVVIECPTNNRLQPDAETLPYDEVGLLGIGIYSTVDAESDAAMDRNASLILDAAIRMQGMLSAAEPEDAAALLHEGAADVQVASIRPLAKEDEGVVAELYASIDTRPSLVESGCIAPHATHTCEWIYALQGSTAASYEKGSTELPVSFQLYGDEFSLNTFRAIVGVLTGDLS